MDVDKLFAYDHLPEGPMREMSKHFNNLAWFLSDDMQNEEAKRQALWELWQAKNIAVWEVAHRG